MEMNFFSLDDYVHQKLFEGCEYPWEPLNNLKGYLSTFSYQSFDDFSHVTFENREQIFIGKGVKIEPGAHIIGPCILGDHTIVRHGAYIRGFVITGKNCVIGHSSELKESILLDEVHVPHFNYVGNSILGNRVNLGAGVKCANFKLTGKEVRVRFQGKIQSTGMKKLGAIMGDGCSLGCNCVTSPGTILSKGKSYLPLTHIKGEG